jgi:Protein of unknown function (DUF3553)
MRFVTHPAKPEWGIGEILSTEGNVATIVFEHAGRKTINVSYVKLQPAEGQAAHKLGGEIPQVSNLDIHAIRKLCDQWYADGGDSTSLHIVSDLRKFGYLTNGTARNLLRWAHQDSNQRLKDLAQQITKSIYGRLISLQELA